jgi:antitoxin ParD1/3/4
MARQSISLAEQNDEWLKNQVAEKEFNSKSEAVNYLIKQARDHKEYVNFVKEKLAKAEESGFAEKQSREEMLTEFKERISNV